MPIHHATLKAAEKLGIRLEGDDESYTATTSKGVVVEATKAKRAVVLAQLGDRFHGEYPKIVVEEDGEEGTVVYDGDHVLARFDLDDTTSNNIDDIFVEALDQLQALVASGEIEEEAEEEAESTGNVVRAKYREQYKARGNPNHCGDWLAGWLDGMFVGSDKGFDARAFEAFLVENGVAIVGKWAALPTSGQKGWQGRYRMNGRQVLEKQIARTGRLVAFGKDQTIPDDVLESIRTRHAKALEAEAKKTAKAA